MPQKPAPTLDWLPQLGQARSRTDELFALLDPARIYERPAAERHRLIFYLGHLEAFDWNQIAVWALNERSQHPEFDSLFARGIDPDADDLPCDQPADWPAVDEVLAYRDRTRARIDELLAEAPPSIVQTAIEHRLMHAETLAYLLHDLPFDAKTPQEQETRKGSVRRGPEVVEIPAGHAILGQPRGSAFGWDNEFDQHTVPVKAFRIDRYKVTNAGYLEFVQAGGSVPHFWTQRDGAFFYRGMFREIPLPPDWPVYVTQQQAAGFAEWKGLRLPTEAEYTRARQFIPEDAGANAGFRSWDPEPVTAGYSNGGPHQLTSNGWEWTSTVFAPFPGFRPEPNYPGYSADFFDGQHYVLKGASPRTDLRFLRPSYRNWFRADYPHIYATFRCVHP